MIPIINAVINNNLANSYINLYTGIGNDIYNFYVTYSRTILDYMHAIFKGSFNIAIYTTMVVAVIYFFMAIIVFIGKQKHPKKTRRTFTPNVTIQIPTYNEIVAIRCAQKCVDFDYPKDKMQIIIGDDSNDKAISAQIDEFERKINKRYPGLLKVTRRGTNTGYKPANLNYMLKHSKGEFVVIFDSDFMPEKDFLKRIVQPLKDKDISVVQARWKAINFDQNIISMLAGSISVMFHHVVIPFTRKINGTALLCGSAEIIRKKDLIEAGSWLSGSLTEDVECTMRLMKHHKKIIYMDDLECGCEVPYTVNDLFKQQMRWAYGIISALKMHLYGILTDKSIKVRDKTSLFILTGLGYVFSLLLFIVTALGVLSVITQTPGPIIWSKFLMETGFNILITSGFLVATTLSLLIDKHMEKIPQVLVSSFTIGIIVMFYVNKGIIKAILGRDMKWFMLKKNGNAKVDVV